MSSWWWFVRITSSMRCLNFSSLQELLSLARQSVGSTLFGTPFRQCLLMFLHSVNSILCGISRFGCSLHWKCVFLSSLPHRNWWWLSWSLNTSRLWITAIVDKRTTSIWCWSGLNTSLIIGFEIRESILQFAKCFWIYVIQVSGFRRYGLQALPLPQFFQFISCDADLSVDWI